MNVRWAKKKTTRQGIITRSDAAIIWFQGIEFRVFFIMLIAILLFRPQGLFGARERGAL